VSRKLAMNSPVPVVVTHTAQQARRGQPLWVRGCR